MADATEHNCPVDDELDDELDIELDPLIFTIGKSQRPSSSVPHGPVSHHHINPDALSTYIYPTNLQVRDYQYNIVLRAFFHNTLVVLPTGLGKTFIASTVILNYTRWFPELKIVFMAPTKPLVAQQIKACCGITGLSPLSMAILLDLSRKNRVNIWEEKNVFFTTPQVVDHDLKLGTVSPKLISLLVIDEAHRAKGNYAYNNVIKFMDRFNPSYRILAMTATPASTVEGVQEIIDNLHISKAEVRTEKSVDICRYLKQKQIKRFHAEPSDDIRHAVDSVCTAIAPILRQANEKGVYDVREPSKINAFTAMDALQRLLANKSINEGQKWASHSLLQILLVAGQCLRRLNIYGIRSFHSYFKKKYQEFLKKALKKATQASRFYQHPEIRNLVKFCELKMKDSSYLGHAKLEIVVSEVGQFFKTTQNSDSRVIIFSEFRESALDIVRAIEHLGDDLKPHIFIGQSKDSKSEEVRLSGPRMKGSPKGQRGILSESDQTSSEMAQSSGMSQKMQTETIRKFKAGKFNILVATSIGEEGLDIGEVDLIVCYDSTSSPIKNVQRMGRTGRNRDGEILLLFSGNEEMKFDRAMGGYEYIQQHIMDGNLVQLHDQNRMIPDQFTPTAEKQFIDIPEENTAIKEEADDDEIIKIATKYMTGCKTKAKTMAKAKTTAAVLGGQMKKMKKFFMPDNVETGFQPVSSILKGPVVEENGGPSQKRPKVEVEVTDEDEHSKDILDLILDSDTDQPLSTENTTPASATMEKEQKKDNMNPNYGVPKKKFAPSSHIVSAKAVSPDLPSDRKIHLRQLPLDVFLPLLTASRTSSPLLGKRKRPINLVDLIETKKNEESSKLHATRTETETETEPQIETNITCVDSEDADDDDFSDNDEILALAKRTQSGDWLTSGLVVKQASIVVGTEETPIQLCQQPAISAAPKKDVLENPATNHEAINTPLYFEPHDSVSTPDQRTDHPPLNESHDCSLHDPLCDPLYESTSSGQILTPQERDDLYINYYVPVDVTDLEKCAVPQPPASSTDSRYRSSKSQSFLRTILKMEEMSEQDAGALVETSQRMARLPFPPLKEVIDLDWTGKKT